MKNLKKKLGKSGGFTMVELLIVVAIIAILVAVSIPMFLSALEESRHGVDKATYRDAVGLANSYYLTHVNDFTKDNTTGPGELYYHVSDTKSGTINTISTGADIATPECTCDYGKAVKEEGLWVLITYTPPEDGTASSIAITTAWDGYMKTLNGTT